jgi:hypothetical protein
VTLVQRRPTLDHLVHTTDEILRRGARRRASGRAAQGLRDRTLGLGEREVA